MKKFAMIGAAGYIAPRHMKAIKETGNTLLAALDKNDSVGVLDSYFPKTAFFTEFERFDRHLEKLKRSNSKIDYITICSPNHLHDAHCRYGLKNDIEVICEKPLVLNPWNLDALELIQDETQNKIYTILQLRLHPEVIKLKERVSNSIKDKIFSLDLTYITARGPWYYASWKGDVEKSGGIASNVGIHFFDMLAWIFGEPSENIVHIHNHDRAAGLLVFKKAEVRWFLSINPDTLPEKRTNPSGTLRFISIDNEVIDFTKGFTDLHTLSYQNIIDGKGFGINDTRSAIDIIHQIRNTAPRGLKGNYHPFASKAKSKHPFSS